MKTKILSETYHIDSRTIHIGITYYPSVYRFIINPNPERFKHSYDIFKARWYTVKRRAEKKGLAFDLTINFVEKTTTSPCLYCGSREKHSELDKKVPQLGYVMTNVVPACRRCNTIKNNVISYGEMLKIVEILGWKK